MEIKLIRDVTEFNDPLNLHPPPYLPTVHIKECPCNRASHTASHRGLLPGQPRLFQISQFFHTSSFINSKVSFHHMLFLFAPRPEQRSSLTLRRPAKFSCFPTWYSPLILRSSWTEQISPLESSSSILPISRRQDVNGAENFTGFHH